jgi:membrane protein implicated in regulation of membrane protease activity
MTVGIVLLIAGGVLVLVEINTLTFYLLAVAVACFAAGAASVYGADVTFTFSLLGVVVLLGLPVAHWVRLRLKTPEADRISNDDVGNDVTVESITPDGLRVVYRGTLWSARVADGNADGVSPGDLLRIARRDGNTLFLERPVQPAEAR